MPEVWEYEDERLKEYNDDLDESGDVVIAEIPFRRSVILYELDKFTYFQEYERFRRTKFEELKQLVFNKFPACIAFHYYLSEKGPNANNEVTQFLHLKDTWEAIVFVLYALTWGEIRAKAINLSDVDVYHSGNPTGRFNTRIVLSDALRQKLENIKAIVQHATNAGLNLLCKNYITLDILENLFELQNNRNDFSHSAAPSPEQARDELLLINPIIESVLGKLTFLADVDFVRFDSFTTTFRFEVFKGHSLNKDYEAITVDTSRIGYVMTNPREVVFAKWNDEIFSVSPFLHFVNDDDGYETYLSVFKGRREGKFWFEPVKRRNEVCFDSLQVRFEAEKTEIQNLLPS